MTQVVVQLDIQHMLDQLPWPAKRTGLTPGALGMGNYGVVKALQVDLAVRLLTDQFDQVFERASEAMV